MGGFDLSEAWADQRPFPSPPQSSSSSSVVSSRVASRPARAETEPPLSSGISPPPEAERLLRAVLREMEANRVNAQRRDAVMMASASLLALLTLNYLNRLRSRVHSLELALLRFG